MIKSPPEVPRIMPGSRLLCSNALTALLTSVIKITLEVVLFTWLMRPTKPNHIMVQTILPLLLCYEISVRCIKEQVKLSAERNIRRWRGRFGNGSGRNNSTFILTDNLLWAFRIFERQIDGKSRTFAKFTFNFNASAVLVNNSVCY